MLGQSLKGVFFRFFEAQDIYRNLEIIHTYTIIMPFGGMFYNFLLLERMFDPEHPGDSHDFPWDPMRSGLWMWSWDGSTFHMPIWPKLTTKSAILGRRQENKVQYLSVNIANSHGHMSYPLGFLHLHRWWSLPLPCEFSRKYDMMHSSYYMSWGGSVGGPPKKPANFWSYEDCLGNWWSSGRDLILLMEEIRLAS